MFLLYSKCFIEFNYKIKDEKNAIKELIREFELESNTLSFS